MTENNYVTNANYPVTGSLVTDNQVNRDIKCDLPRPFSGNGNDLRRFLTQFDLVFRLAPGKFVSDEIKVLSMATSMVDKAFTFVEPILQNPNLLKCYEQFISELKKRFSDQNEIFIAQSKIQRLKQGQKTISEYVD